MKYLIRMSAALAALILVFLSIGYWNATRPPVVTQVRLPLAGLPPGHEVRVVQLTDIHYGFPDMRTPRLLRIVAKANSLRPDLIVLTGDYMGGKLRDWPRSYLEEALPPLAGLRAPLGVFAVLGNHDQPGWTARILAQQVRPKLLVNQHVDVGPLVVAGLASIEFGPSKPVEQVIGGVPPGRPILLLRHEGDAMKFANVHPKHNPVLVLAGHTHGGQVLLPIVGSVGNRYYSHTPCRRGLCTINGWRVFVSSGLGTSVLPIRFGVPPEIALITLYSPEVGASAVSASARR